jgi:hypothetical protein
LGRGNFKTTTETVRGGARVKIKAWNIGIVWDDDTEEALSDIPNWVATRVDEFLNELEEEYDE